MSAAPGGSAWMQHYQFAERTQYLAHHLAAILELADSGRHHSSLVVARTALEHHLLDRLLLLADRYVEVIRPDDPAVIADWEQQWQLKSEGWTESVEAVERTRDGKSLRLIRRGHVVRDDTGAERERISPYWLAMEHYDAFVGHPDQQAATVRPFDDLETRIEWSRRNQALYGAYMRWSSICRNLELNTLVQPNEVVRLQVHYTFLSAFSHASQSGYELNLRPVQGSPTADHLLGELSLLYVCTLAVTEIETWDSYIGARSHLLAPLDPEVRALAGEVASLVSYFWFLGGRPQDLDRCAEANRRAHPLLLAGRRLEVRPHQIPDEEVLYYQNPLERLARLHAGDREITTGFGCKPLWSTLHW